MFAGQSQKEADRLADEAPIDVEPFHQTLLKHGLRLDRGQTATLQVNVGFACNQVCRHCHLNAGPERTENMDLATVNEVVSYAGRGRFDAIDITGGAPELNPNLVDLIEGLYLYAPKIMLRSNLTALNDCEGDYLMEFLKARSVDIVASFPSLNESQADSQRGKGVFEKSIDVFKKLNAMGYGQDGSDLELNLVSNPTGAFLPPSQEQAEKRFRQVLEQKWGLVFNNLFNFANVPLGRFRQWLLKSGNFEGYLKKLASSFNPCAVEGVMCRTLVTVSWDGYLYDCDFNIVKGLYLGGRKTHISQMQGVPEPGSSIAVGDHCYTCTAGAGFT